MDLPSALLQTLSTQKDLFLSYRKGVPESSTNPGLGPTVLWSDGTRVFHEVSKEEALSLKKLGIDVYVVQSVRDNKLSYFGYAIEAGSDEIEYDKEEQWAMISKI